MSSNDLFTYTKTDIAFITLKLCKLHKRDTSYLCIFTDVIYMNMRIEISVITITIDGKEIESCGDTCVFVEDGLNSEVDFTEERIKSMTDGSLSDNTIVAEFVNKYKNMFGKSRVVVIKSQLGQPITAYSGEEVYWEIPDDLPKMTKLMIDGKALYIHRANFQIIDKELLN